MTFKVIDKKTGKEPTYRVIQNIAKRGGLLEMDIDQFFVGEDGSLVLVDDCGNMTYCDTKRFKIVPQEADSHEIETNAREAERRRQETIRTAIEEAKALYRAYH